MNSEAEYTLPREECPNPGLWHARDIDATEVEVSELVGSLVRCLQPEFCLETGSYDGQTTNAIAKALYLNGHGDLVSLEIDPKRAKASSEAVQFDYPCDVICTSSAKYETTRKIDFAFFDSDQYRGLEFLRFYPHMHSGTVVVFHDTGKHHRVIREQVEELQHRGLLNPIFLMTPRGVAICTVNGGVE